MRFVVWTKKPQLRKLVCYTIHLLVLIINIFIMLHVILLVDIFFHLTFWFFNDIKYHV